MVSAVVMAVSPDPGIGRNVLVDEVVATVNRHVITRSEVKQEGILALVELRGEKGLERRLTPGFLNQVMELLIDQRVLLDEALRMGLPPVTADEQEKLLEGFRQKFTGEESYQRFLYEHDLTEAAVAEVLARHLRVERLKDKKLRSMPEVNNAAVKRYYETHRLQLGGKPLKTVAEAIRLKLLTEQREKSLARWVWELRKRSEVKVLVNLAGETAGD